MRAILCLLSYFVFCSISAQDRIPVAGSIKTEKFPLENVHIRNISSQKATFSGNAGRFLLNMQTGDTLLLTYVGMQDLINFITPEELQQQPLLFEMLQKPEELEEVVLNRHSEINAVALGIIPKKIKTLTTNERRLRTAGDFKLILIGTFGR